MSQLRKDLNDLEENGQLGDWCFQVEETSQGTEERFYFRHPHGNAPYSRGEAMHLPICTGTKVPSRWLWDGNRESPTITPSIDIKGIWHGWLTAGKLITA